MASDEHKLNIELCSEIEKHPCLYDVNLEDHSRRLVVEQAWTEVAEQVNLSVEACKKRWGNLRTVYVRKSKLPRRSFHPTREYYLSKHMQFLKPHIKPTVLSPAPNEHSQFKIVQPPKSEQGQSSESQHTNRYVDDIDSVEEHSTIDGVVEIQNDDDTMDRRQNIIYPTQHHRKKRTKRMSKIDEALLDYFQFKKRKLSDDPENPRRYFMLSLMPEVNALSEEQFKKFKRRVLALIDELDTPHGCDNVL